MSILVNFMQVRKLLDSWQITALYLLICAWENTGKNKKSHLRM